jgi:hypothetical protein
MMLQSLALGVLGCGVGGAWLHMCKRLMEAGRPTWLDDPNLRSLPQTTQSSLSQLIRHALQYF